MAVDNVARGLAAIPSAPPLWIGTQVEYDALGSYDPNRLYVITA